jgi:hypothetical protein
MIWYEDYAKSIFGISLSEKVLKPMAKRQVLFHLSKLVFVSDTVILNTDLSMFPLGPHRPESATSFFVSSSISFNHEKIAIHITFINMVVLDELDKWKIMEDIRTLTQKIELLDDIGIWELIFMSKG